MSGIIGAYIGSSFGKAFDGQKLLLLFGLVMILVVVLMFRKKNAGGNPFVELTQESAAILLPRLSGAGFGVGMLLGFFGIGGGFLVVPGHRHADARCGGIIFRFGNGVRL